jgi:uncharacterized protein (TIGR00730 family)
MLFPHMRSWLITAWHLLRSYFQTICGAWKVSELEPPVVTIFGGARIPQDYEYAKKAAELGGMLSRAGISVLTGGGPGIMQAVSCSITPLHGKAAGKGKILGIGVTDLGDKAPNQCVHEYIELKYFFARKWLLTRYSSGIVVFPGGFGTLDELFELITLVQTNKMQRVPIILFGVEYWNPLFNWIINEVLQHGFVGEEDIRLFTITDDLEMVFCLLRDECAVEEDSPRIRSRN